MNREKKEYLMSANLPLKSPEDACHHQPPLPSVPPSYHATLPISSISPQNRETLPTAAVTSSLGAVHPFSMPESGSYVDCCRVQERNGPPCEGHHARDERMVQALRTVTRTTLWERRVSGTNSSRIIGFAARRGSSCPHMISQFSAGK